MGNKYKGGVVGLRMGLNHVLALAKHQDVELAAICDIDGNLANWMADQIAGIKDESADDSVGQSKKDFAESGRPASPYTGPVQPRPNVYTDYSAMIKTEGLDIVSIASPNRFHSAMTIEAAKAGVKAICCEKPIAVDLKEAREMASVCGETGTKLIVNHQRRLGSDFNWVREQIQSGALGDISLIRGACAGDMLSDGTHLIDSSLFISGDVDWSWVYASHNREDYEAAARKAAESEAGGGQTQTSGGGFDATGGWRFGHPVEDGMFTVLQLETGIRIELFTGNLRPMERPYHDIEVIGTKGSVWRSGDRGGENLFKRGNSGEWEAVTDLDTKVSQDNIQASYNRLVELLKTNAPDTDHPLGTPYTMRGFELLMGIYESARVGEIIHPPVTQEGYPLAIQLGIE